MKKITLNRLDIKNFKGCSSNIIDFSNETTIKGANATGKTTIYDAFLWLFFGKDSTDRKDFAVKPLNKDGNEKHNLEIEVRGLILVDGVEVELKRVQKENWVKPRGQEEKILKGNVQEFWINEVPKNLKEYTPYIDALIPENIFKIISKTSYFNSLNWKDMRKGLLSLVDEINDADILSEDKFKDLANNLSGKTLDEYTKQIKSEIKTCKDSIKTIPARIEEKNREFIEVEKTGGEITAEVNKIDSDIIKIDSQINDANNKVSEHVKAQSLIKSDIATLERKQKDLIEKANNPKNDKAEKRDSDLKKVNSYIIEKDQYIKSKQTLLDSNNSTIKSIHSQAKHLKEANDIIREQAQQTVNKINETKALLFDDSKAICPTCQQSLAADKLEEAKSNFTKNKADKINDLNRSFETSKEQGLANKRTIDESDSKIKNLEDTNKLLSEAISKLKEEREVLVKEKSNLESLDVTIKKVDATQSQEYKNLTAEIAEKQALIKDVSVDNSELVAERKELNDKREVLVKILNTIDGNLKIKTRIKELETEQRTTSQEITRLEGVEFNILAFNKAKINAVEEKINSLFSLCRFKMFETLITTGESVECCKCLINGTPYSDLNTASKVNAGLDIINVFSSKFGYSAPVFIDNRESVSNTIDVDSQIINLVVDYRYKNLIINEIGANLPVNYSEEYYKEVSDAEKYYKETLDGKESKD